MSPPAKHRAPQPSTPDSESSVRERVTPAPEPTAVQLPATALSSAGGRDRLEAKLKAARTVLAGLPASDDRARLLHVAIMRRDEALLDGVLSALGVTYKLSVPPPSR